MSLLLFVCLFVTVAAGRARLFEVSLPLRPQPNAGASFIHQPLRQRPVRAQELPAGSKVSVYIYSYIQYVSEMSLAAETLSVTQAGDLILVEPDVISHPELGSSGGRLVPQQTLCPLEVISVPPAEQRVEGQRLPRSLAHPGIHFHIRFSYTGEELYRTTQSLCLCVCVFTRAGPGTVCRSGH